MLRRSVAALIVCASALTIAACGIKGPLRLPPGASAPAPTGAPPSAIPSESPTTPPASRAPASAPEPDDKDHAE